MTAELQQAAPVTEPELLHRYRTAAALAPDRLLALMRNRTIQPHWTGDGDAFWYRRDRKDGGHEFVLIDPNTFSSKTFDHEPAGPPQQPSGLHSTDGQQSLFCREHNLWLRDAATGQEQALTTDGEPHHAWGAAPDNTLVHIPLKRAGTELAPMFAAFSPSGRKVVTARLDERDLADYPFVEQLPATGARPVLHPIRSRLEEDPPAPPAEIAVIDLTTGDRTVVSFDPTALGNGFATIAWETDESGLYLLEHAIGTATATLQRIDVRTGNRHTVLTETDDPIYESNTFLYNLPLVAVLPRSRAVVWFSQRDGRGHLYRYDLDTGKCLNRITSGNLVVRDLLRIDEDSGELLFLAGCGDDGHNPYWRKLYRARLDGSEQTLLTPEPLDHEIPGPAPQFFELVFGSQSAPMISPSGRFVIDHMSTVSQPPQIVLRETGAGAIIGTLENTDITALEATGYVAPQQFRVQVDGDTDIWGVLTLPADPVDAASIPVVDLMYAGFQVSSQPTSFLGPSFSQKQVLPAAAFAALGFATVVLDGRGTSGRDKSFRQWTHGHPDTDRGLADHVSAIRELAARNPALDAGRVGVTGHSYGGYNSVRSMLLFPDFFRVAVSSAGVHVPEKMPQGSWAWHVGADEPRDSVRYQALGNLPLADRLQGKLLLLFGDLDENATPDHTLALADALAEAGKRFDMKLWPGMDHYRNGTSYIRMVTWDYFVEHLLGLAPPATFTP